MSTCEISFLKPNWQEFQETSGNIQMQIFSEPCPPELIVKQLASIEGFVDIYFWYEGSLCLPTIGAQFMKEKLFKPLYKLKQDTKLCLYSLKAWDFKTSTSTTALGEAINRINTRSLECIYSSSFFQYCVEAAKDKSFYTFISEELPKKEWLFKLSNAKRKNGMTVGAFFENQSSLFDCIKAFDLSAAYSPMQYVEAYYLIHESVKNGLSKEQKKIEIAFALPNDESKYYLDLPKDIEKMLLLDFGKDLADVQVNISFQFFQYEDIGARPYIDKRPHASKVKPNEVSYYFDYLFQQSFPQVKSKTSFLRDVIHHLNE